MADDHNDKLNIHVNIKISANALQAVVANAKQTVPKSPDGTYRVDTADFVGAMVSRFLDERDFETYAMDVGNYKFD